MDTDEVMALFAEAPQFLEDGAAFSRLPMPVQRAVMRDWVACMREGSIRGAGLVPHYNLLKVCEAEGMFA